MSAPLTEIPAAAPSVICCTICQTSFTSRNQLFQHIRKTHQESHTTLSSATLQYDQSQYQDIEVLYEDAVCKVIIKPQGLSTMGAKDTVTLMNHRALFIPAHFKHGVSYRRAIPCHRLDRATGGIVVCSKSTEAEACIRLCFRHKFVHKRYRAIIGGQLPQVEGMIDAKINNKEALTKYKVIEQTRSKQYGWITTVDLWPVTGRRHQLRRHMHAIGLFIVGDRRYSKAFQWPQGIDQLFLWSVETSFPHPDALKEVIEAKDGDAIKLLDRVQSQNDNSDDEDEEDNGHQDKKCKPNPNSEQQAGEQENAVDIAACRAQLEALIEPLQKVHVMIEEPTYYAQFRKRHEEEYEVACKEAEGLS